MPIKVPSILDAQRRGVEIGRIRLGAKIAFTNRDGQAKERPSKLAEFRLTSPNREAIAAAAELLGGEAKPWASPSGPQWEVFSQADVLDVLIPPGEPIQQDMELWGKRNPRDKKDPVVCLRRCAGGPDDDGTPPINRIDGTPCACPADDAKRVEMAAAGSACKPTTRLRVMLPTLPGIGVWRVESHGFYAAVELVGRHKLLAEAAALGIWVPARLRLEQRQRHGKSWGVPVLDIGVSMAQIHAGEGVGRLPEVLAAKAPLALEPASRAALPAAGAEAPAAAPRKEELPPADRAQKYAGAALATTDLAKIREYAGYAGKAGLLEEFVSIDPDEPMVLLKDFLAQRLEILSGAEIPA